MKTIEDIAFQTDILAWHAAIEAARAGSAGKGFAVATDEVRNLAAKSAQAAQNTTVLMQGRVDAVQEGHDIAVMTAEAWKKAVTQTATTNSNYRQTIYRAYVKGLCLTMHQSLIQT